MHLSGRIGASERLDRDERADDHEKAAPALWMASKSGFKEVAQALLGAKALVDAAAVALGDGLRG